MKLISRLALSSVFLVVAACGNSEGDDDNGMNGSKTRDLTLSFTGLPQLGASMVYEGWVIVNGAPITTGRFTVNKDGDLSQSVFPIDATHAETATDFVLTLAPATGDDPAPSRTHILAGPFRTPGSGNAAAAEPWAPLSTPLEPL